MALPPDDLALNTARNARILLDHGFTSAYSAGALGKTIEMFLKTHIDSGGMPGPRLIASLDRTGTAQRISLFGSREGRRPRRGPEAVRAFVRDCAALGAKTSNSLLSGESALKPGASQEFSIREEEVRAAGEQAQRIECLANRARACRRSRQNGSAQSLSGAVSLHLCRRRGDRHAGGEKGAKFSSAPSIGIVQATLDATPPPHFDMTHMKADAAIVLDRQKKLVPILKSRGVRLLPGGTTVSVQPQRPQRPRHRAFVKHLGFSPTRSPIGGNEARRRNHGHGRGTRANQGRVSRRSSVGQRESRKRCGGAAVCGQSTAIMKDGKFHRGHPLGDFRLWNSGTLRAADPRARCGPRHAVYAVAGDISRCWHSNGEMASPSRAISSTVQTNGIASMFIGPRRAAPARCRS